MSFHSLTSLSAITLSVKDMETSTNFYDTLGLEKVYSSDDFTSYKITEGQFINLQLSRDEFHSKGWGRPIFYVSDVDSFYNRLVTTGFKPEFAPRNAKWGERYFHAYDPDGHELSFAKRLPQQQSM